MKAINPDQKIRNPSLTLYAFLLRHTISQSPQEVEADAPQLWEKFEQLAPVLLLPDLNSLYDKLICYQNGNYDPVAEDKLLRGNVGSLLRPDADPYFSSIPQDGLQLRAMIDPYRINDTYAVDLTLFSEDELTIDQLSHLNPQGCLLPQNIQASIGQTLIFFAEPVGEVADYQILAQKCLQELLQSENLPNSIAQGRLFGSPLFEYHTTELDPQLRCHVILWFGDAQTLNRAEQFDWVNLLCSYHKILYIYHQSRYCKQAAYQLYHQLEQIKAQLSDVLDPATLRTSNQITQLKECLATLPQMQLRYASYWQEMKDHQTAITTNITNYCKLIINLPNLESDGLKLLRLNENQYQGQIGVDLNFLEPGRELFATVIATIREELALKQPNLLPNQPQSYLVNLILGDGNFNIGFPAVIAQIWSPSEAYPIQCVAKLPRFPKIPQVYSQIQAKISARCGSYRMEKTDTKITRFSKQNDIDPLAKELSQLLNSWLNSQGFLPIQKKLREKLKPGDEVRVIIQTENIELQRVPWQLWDFFKAYPKAEVALSARSYERVERTTPTRTQIRILSILGDNKGIKLDEDKKVLNNLPDAEPTVFLEKPSRQELTESLWDKQGWDILSFSGHSSSHLDGSEGWIYINDNDKLALADLQKTLKKAISFGLQIAIFNSCDGLGLARVLASLHIPLLIVMGEPVPDVVAQEFLKNFLTAFAGGKSFYLAVREAREKLESMEDFFPCASWLPVIYQNPAEVPPTWKSLVQ